MTLDNIVTFIKMDGYGSYVWLSLISFIIVFVLLWIFPYRQLRNPIKSYHEQN